MANLKNKVAIVLGSSAQGGTGWAIAEALAACGAKVAVAARTASGIKKLARSIGGLAIECDAAAEGQVKNLVNQTVNHFGRVDIAVNSAGLPVMSTIAASTSKDIVSAASVNYYANVFFVKYCAEGMTDGGSIILITSMSTTHVVEPHFAYACAKAATDCLVRYAALEYGPRNIKVNSINPGLIKSEMARAALAVPGLEQAFIDETPLRRISKPEDIAEAAVWLAGPSFVTGLNIPVNGGNQLTRFPFTSELSARGNAYDGTIPIGDRATA